GGGAGAGLGDRVGPWRHADRVRGPTVADVGRLVGPAVDVQVEASRVCGGQQPLLQLEAGLVAAVGDGAGDLVVGVQDHLGAGGAAADGVAVGVDAGGDRGVLGEVGGGAAGAGLAHGVGAGAQGEGAGGGAVAAGGLGDPVQLEVEAARVA